MGQIIKTNCDCNWYSKDKEDGDTANCYNNNMSISENNYPIPKLFSKEKGEKPSQDFSEKTSYEKTNRHKILSNIQKNGSKLKLECGNRQDNSTSYITKTKEHQKNDRAQPEYLQAMIRGMLSRKHFNNSRQMLIVKSYEFINSLLTEYNKKEYSYIDSHIAEPFSQEGYLKNEKTKDYKPISDKDLGHIYKNKTLICEYNNVKSLYHGSFNFFNERHGQGTLYTSNGVKYQGSWIYNEFTGWGRMTEIKESKSVTEGLFTNGKINGMGFRHWADKIYEGDFKEGIMEGFGIEESNIYRYKGHYANNMKNGKGKVEYIETHDVYVGDFKDNCLTGKGYYVWDNQHTYRGEFLNGNMHGRGRYEWPEGGYYEGEYLNNLKEGYGEFKWPEGNIFRGRFKNGLPEGVGKLITKTKIMDVEFINNKMVIKSKKS